MGGFLISSFIRTISIFYTQSLKK